MSDELAKLKDRCDRLELLYQVSKVIHSTLEPHRALTLILGEAVQLMRASSGSIVLFNPTTGFLEIQASHGLPEGASQLKLRPGEGITGCVAQTGKPARVGDVTQDRRYVMVQQNVRSELAVPLEVNGIVRGVLNVDSDRLNAFSAEMSLIVPSAVRRDASRPPFFSESARSSCSGLRARCRSSIFPSCFFSVILGKYRSKRYSSARPVPRPSRLLGRLGVPLRDPFVVGSGAES